MKTKKKAYIPDTDAIVYGADRQNFNVMLDTNMTTKINFTIYPDKDIPDINEL